MNIIKFENKGKGGGCYLETRSFLVMQWLEKARAKEERPGLNRIAKINGVWYATDGHRLHAFFADEYYGCNAEDGVYRVFAKDRKSIVLQKTEEQYPDVERVWPEHKNFITKLLRYDGGNSFSISYTEVVRTMDKDYTIDYSYFKDAMGDDGDFDVFLYREKSPVAFATDDRMALIMPLQIS